MKNISRVLNSSIIKILGPGSPHTFLLKQAYSTFLGASHDFFNLLLCGAYLVYFSFAPKRVNLYLVLDIASVRLPRSVARRRVQHYPSRYTHLHQFTTTSLVTQLIVPIFCAKKPLAAFCSNVTHLGNLAPTGRTPCIQRRAYPKSSRIHILQI